MTTDQGTALARVEEVDRQDESQIMRHMSGELVTEYVYKFTDGARRREQKGLSWAGTRELAQLLGSIEVEAEPQIDLRDDGRRQGVVLPSHMPGDGQAQKRSDRAWRRT